MNNQNNVGQYGYVNRNGRLVPTNTIKNETSRKQPQSNTTSTQKQKNHPVTEQQKKQQTYAQRTVEKANKQNEKKERNIGKGIKKLCFSLSLVLILSAVKQMPFNIKTRITELANKNGEHNYMDDVFTSDEQIEVVNPESGKTEKIQLEDATNKLEDYVAICKLIDDLKIKDVKYSELKDHEKEAAISLYEEDGIDGLIELYKDNTSNPIEKARTARQLMFIRDHFGGAWIKQNGLKVAENLLEKTIQTAAIEHYGTFEPSEYGVVEIPSDNEFPYFLVTLKDPVSGATDDVIFTPVVAGEYTEAMLMLRELRSLDGSKLSEQEKLAKIQKAINIVRRCLGKEVEDICGITYTKKLK